MRRGAAAVVVAASILYVALVSGTIRRAGVNYEEIVPYVLTSFDIRDVVPQAPPGGAPPRLVTSPWLPRLAFEPVEGVRLPLLNQLYMTDHLSYGGVALAALGLDPLWAARGWHALFGLVLLWILYDCAILLGLGRRGAALTIVLAATSLQVIACYTAARFDESLPSFGTVVVLWAALRHGRDGRRRWIWLGIFAAAVAVSGKVTALWSLAALAAAGSLAGWRPPAPRTLVRPLLATLPLFAPMVGFALAGPSAAGYSTWDEVSRRLAFFADLLTADVLIGSAANLIEYLGNWGGIVSEIARGTEARGANDFGRLFVSAVLIWMMARALAPGAVPRRRRLETQMLAFLAVVFALVTMFFREHRDFQFVLLVPFHALAMAAFLEWVATRFLDSRLPRWVAGALVCALPLASNLREQVGVRADLAAAKNAMLDLRVQKESARWLVDHGARRPIVVTFYAVGSYELFTNRAVRPIYMFPMMRASKDGSYVPDFDAIWRSVLGGGPDEFRYVVLPLGENTVEARHFDEATIRASLLRVSTGERLQVFANANGDALLEVWRVAAVAP
jgi:hypothetical protein